MKKKKKFFTKNVGKSAMLIIREVLKIAIQLNNNDIEVEQTQTKTENVQTS